MRLQSSAFNHHQFLPSAYTCDGGNFNPPLSFSDIPPTAQSLVLIVDDPDAPAGIWTHWTVWNISPVLSEILENSVPAGAREGLTSFNRLGYAGPCPPSGIHRYFFRLYALDTILNLPNSVRPNELKQTLNGHILDSAELIGLYQR